MATTPEPSPPQPLPPVPAAGADAPARDRPTNLAGAIYGTVLAESIVAGADESLGAIHGAVAIFVAACVFWVAHVHATLAARWVASGERPSREVVGREMRHEWPMAQASIPIALPYVFAAVGLWSVSTASDLASLIGLVALAGWGLAAARAARMRLLGTVWTVGINVAIGVAIIGLKALVH